jgi:hypothetical protein
MNVRYKYAGCAAGLHILVRNARAETYSNYGRDIIYNYLTGRGVSRRFD